jgi:hypothetical protein
VSNLNYGSHYYHLKIESFFPHSSVFNGIQSKKQFIGPCKVQSLCSWLALRQLIFIYLPPPPVAVQSLKDLGSLTYRRFRELFSQMVGLLGRVISPSQGFYLHRTTQHRKTRTNIHALSGIRTHDPSNQPTKNHTSDRKATVTGWSLSILY